MSQADDDPEIWATWRQRTAVCPASKQHHISGLAFDQSSDSRLSLSDDEVAFPSGREQHGPRLRRDVPRSSPCHQSCPWLISVCPEAWPQHALYVETATIPYVERLCPEQTTTGRWFRVTPATPHLKDMPGPISVRSEAVTTTSPALSQQRQPNEDTPRASSPWAVSLASSTPDALLWPDTYGDHH
jgi:hypothetical protein